VAKKQWNGRNAPALWSLVLRKRAGFLDEMRSHCGASVAVSPQFRRRNSQNKTAARLGPRGRYNFKSVSCR
jgi:hypothetical protein